MPMDYWDHAPIEEIAIEVWEDESPAAQNGNPPDRPAGPPPKGVPSGLPTGGWREESDSVGTMRVPNDRFWGAQTQRSLEHFAIGDERMPLALIHAYGQVKEATALANANLGVLEARKARAIAAAAREVADGWLDGHFPLSVYQTGSGTHTHANVNEVIAHRASQILGGPVGVAAVVHPSDDVNRSQSTNDTFVTAMHVAAVELLRSRTLPSTAELTDELTAKAEAWAAVPKAGRTHLMDATTLTVGQEWSGYVAALHAARRHLIASLHDLQEVALGGTAVGTGQNAPEGFTALACHYLSEITGHPFRPAFNAFAAQGTLDPLVRAHAALKSLAVTLYKITNDVRWLGSGPDHGLNEVVFPQWEPGSTIMPAKVNPTQAESAMMACLQVLGADTTVSMAGAEGNFELNAFRPIVISNFIRSGTLLADVSHGLSRYLVRGLELSQRMADEATQLDSVSLATALAVHVGHERAAAIARTARANHTDVMREARSAGVEESIIEAVRETVGHLRRVS